MTGGPPDRLSEWMAASLRGDRDAYEAALHEIARIVAAYARARVGSTLADEVVQETLWSVHRARATYDPRRPFGPWLMAIARSRLVDVVRRTRAWRLREAPLEQEPLAPAEADAEPSPRMTEALRQLPALQRRVIEMLKVEGRSTIEVARALGLSASNVKVTAHRGYRALRHLLKEWP